jgi:hypothetical protein
MQIEYMVHFVHDEPEFEYKWQKESEYEWKQKI